MDAALLPDLRYMETGSTSAPFNLAVEELITEGLGLDDPGIFMLWQNAPSVIIGRHQNARSEVNLPELEKRGIDLVRRLTGGGAVYHDLGNVNFTFVLPRRPGEKELGAAELLAPLIDCFAKLGVTARMEGRNDLSIPGRGKFSGLAGRRLPGKFLLHGTILYDVDLGVLEEVLLVDPEKYRSKGVASVRARVANLNEYLSIGLPELWAAMRGAYATKTLPLPEGLPDAAKALAARRYANPAWNVGQSPPGDITLKRRFPFGSLELRLGTRGNLIRECVITGDFLTPEKGSDEIPVDALASALTGLPADAPAAWAAAWDDFDLGRVFHAAGPDSGAEVGEWLRTAV